MRIGIDASRANLGVKTGTEWYAFNLLKAWLPLTASRDQVVLYLKAEPLAEWGRLPKNVEFRVLRWWPKIMWTQLRLAWEMLFHPPEILFVPAHTVPMICPRKTITTLHDIGFEHAQELYSQQNLLGQGIGSRILNFLIRVLTLGKYSATEFDYHRFSARLALKKCSVILTVSEYSKQDIIKTYGLDPSRVEVIPNGVDTQIFKPEIRHESAKIEEILKKFGLQKPYLMTLGRIEKKKNSLGLLAAFRELRAKPENQKLKLLFVGPAGLGGEEVFQQIKNWNLADSVICPGWVKPTELPYLLAGAEVFALPSFFEGFGIPILEAMACGTPVVCSNSTALPEVAGSAAFLVNPYKSGEIAQAIQKILADPKLADAYRTAGWQRVKAFTWQRSAELFDRIIHFKV
ncbi:glycosyltransferase family 1 protein [Candidatus Parcubacteria bacterium]|jgi:glycosyltransferase involved in cell wall biosynthesis|nr:MAG: glycosyltransferase family 1 protein [Candidatus Parcubacteria bacterium]